MYGLEDLKQSIYISEAKVECPVKGCAMKVERQRETFRRDPKYYCNEHKIFISPSTFEYERYDMNILWRQDLTLLDRVFKDKRESRMARDNSEDALTFNVFRYLERDNKVFQFWLRALTGEHIDNSSLAYWSHEINTGKVYPLLNKARKEFGERLSRSSEPDLIIISKKHLIFVEAKLTATNNTKPSNPKETKKYFTGGGNWYKEVFQAQYSDVALVNRKYEFLRFWLLGTWMANQEKKSFYLINLVLDGREKNIEEKMNELPRPSKNRKFKRESWESIMSLVGSNGEKTAERSQLQRYMANKTIGYRNGNLRKAFGQFAI